MVVKKKKSRAVNPSAKHAQLLQEFYQLLALAVTDNFPGGKSDYRKLQLMFDGVYLSLWQVLYQQIPTLVGSWPEWQTIFSEPDNSPKTTSEKGSKFKRYGASPVAKAPEKLSDFDKQFRKTSLILAKRTRKYIRQAICNSLHRLENQLDFQQAANKLMQTLSGSQLEKKPEALPILDACQPTRLTSDVVSGVLEAIRDHGRALKELEYPYARTKPVSWNLAMAMRVQVQINMTYRDRVSRMVAAAESEFTKVFCREILSGEIMPRVRALIANPALLRLVLKGD